jgi:aldehyde reductase
MSASKMIYLNLNNGKQMPIIGLGTWLSKKGEVYQGIKDAIDCGYRHIDCALVYGNEDEIGKALAESMKAKKVKREELYIVTKLWLTYTRPDRVIKGIERSLKNLGLTYIDLYLMHWPHSFAQQDQSFFPYDKNGVIRGEDVDYVDTWKAMEELVTKGLTKSIGVSNFNSKQIERLLKTATIKPVVNQIEVHPYMAQKKLIDFCRQREIQITAYAPLCSPTSTATTAEQKAKHDLLQDPVVKKIAEKYKKNTGQVLLRFAVDRNYAVIPKSVSKARIASNIQIFDFKLTDEEVKQLEGLDCGYRTCTMAEFKGTPNLKHYPFQKDIEF